MSEVGIVVSEGLLELPCRVVLVCASSSAPRRRSSSRSYRRAARAGALTHAIFARAGLTEAAAQELAAHRGIAVDLHLPMRDLADEAAE